MTETNLNTLLSHRQQFLGFVRRRVQDQGLAEDLLQGAYLRALKSEGTPQDEESVVAWFYRILRNAVIDQYRRKTTESKALSAWGKELEAEVIPAPDLRNEICACLSKVLDQLPANYADLLKSVDLGEQPLQQFAAEQGISAGNAAVRAHRARASLRKQLTRTCGACSEHGCIDCTCRKQNISV
ncbi:MAG: sigma-70 family RNA polymerase sigma factor [Acidobacteriaceae bacterium]|nr:sigma-70 family RNA polymerase sigma factor [Acidobacteriaceae bacterium]